MLDTNFVLDQISDIREIEKRFVKQDKLGLSWAKLSTTGTGLEYFFRSSAQCKIYVIQLT